MKLTENQKRFCDEYIRTGNISESYRLAYPNVKKESSASAAGSRLLKNVNARSYVDKRLDELKKESIAEQDEVLQYLTSVMRGEIKDEMLLVTGDETGSGVEKHEKRSDTMARTKAAELLGKRYVMWTDKQQIEGELGVNIIDDIGEDDE
jgi:phage terminase small subunit